MAAHAGCNKYSSKGVIMKWKAFRRLVTYFIHYLICNKMHWSRYWSKNPIKSNIYFEYATHNMHTELIVNPLPIVDYACALQATSSVSCTLRHGECASNVTCETNQGVRRCKSYYNCISENVPSSGSTTLQIPLCQRDEFFVPSLMTCLRIPSAAQGTSSGE